MPVCCRTPISVCLSFFLFVPIPLLSASFSSCLLYYLLTQLCRFVCLPALSVCVPVFLISLVIYTNWRIPSSHMLITTQPIAYLEPAIFLVRRPAASVRTVGHSVACNVLFRIRPTLSGDLSDSSKALQINLYPLPAVVGLGGPSPDVTASFLEVQSGQ